ncbi:MAG: hypothetical protein WC027_02255 [Candidatus Paceibacterota bacterium]
MTEEFPKYDEIADERTASEILETDQTLSDEEQEHLISLIVDTQLSAEVLTLADFNHRELTQAQKERLMSQVVTNIDVAFSFYINLVESGVIAEPTQEERWWISRLEKSLSQTDIPEIARYLSEHAISLTPENREQLNRGFR